MGRILFYGSFSVVIAIGSWFYFKGEQVPEELLPVIILLFALMSFGYGEKAKEDGDIGAGSGKIRRDKNPRVFRVALYFNYLITGALLVWGIFMLVG